MEEFTRLIGNCPEVRNDKNAGDGRPPILVYKQALITAHYLGGNEPYNLLVKNLLCVKQQDITLYFTFATVSLITMLIGL